ncbi:MAG: hypothetical protein J5I93_27865, partial [Pirellulaceae bacterium]|nr:hypothetical protein [Pirellulaceae bacterium]
GDDRAGSGASTDAELAAARQAADAGQVELAQAICLRILSSRPGQAEAIYLLGLTSLASGQADAAEARFRQVLYLDPRHEDALVHMMLLAEQRGDSRSAANYRRRVQRLSRSEGER